MHQFIKLLSFVTILPIATMNLVENCFSLPNTHAYVKYLHEEQNIP